MPIKKTSLTPFLCASALTLSTATCQARGADIASFSIAGLLKGQTSGQLSCVDIAKATLARVAELDAPLKAFISVNPKLMSDAAELDRQRREGRMLTLHCVPMAFKDNIDVAGLPTTGGSVLLRENTPARDATVVQRLRAAGALIVGKTNLDEFAVAGSTISSIRGQTLNPYDATRFAAGSSGGSAVAVSTGMATCALGTETVNSLRNAASSAGVVAMRTTHGMVSRNGVIPQSSTMDVVGPICRSVADASRVLAVIMGRDALDPQTTGFEGLKSPLGNGDPQPASLAGKRFGVLTNLMGRDKDHEPVNAVVGAALAALRGAGPQIVEIDDTEFDSDTSSQRLNVSNYEFRPLFEAYLATLPPTVGPRTAKEYYDRGLYPKRTMEKFLANAVSWRDPLNMQPYLDALRYREQFRAKVLGMMDDQKLDGLLYPSQKRPALLLNDKPRPERNGVFASALGFPAIDIPAGFSTPTANAPVGLPVGLDVMARPDDDTGLLSLASTIERVLHARRAPALPGGAAQ